MTISHTSLVTRNFRPAVLRGESRRSGIPRRRITLLFTLFTVHCSLFTASAQTEITWDVETSKNISIPRDIRRGESLNLLPRFLSYGVVTQLTNSASVQLYYRSSDMSNGLYYVLTGAVHSATGGIARIPWTASACGTATNYTYDIVIQTNSVISNLRGFGTIRLLDGVYSQALTATNPTAWRLLDWSTISNLNLGSAPFPTSITVTASATNVEFSALLNVPTIWPGTATDSVARASASAASLAASNAQTTADAGTNHAARVDNPHSVTATQIGANTNNASTIDSGTLADARIAATIARDYEVSIATNAAIDDATQRVAAVGYLLPASTSALATAASVVAATQTIAGASVSGTVPAATWSAVSASSTNAMSAGYATTAGSAGSADSANYAGYLVGDLGYAFGYVTPSGFYSDDGMGGAQTWYLYGPLRILSGNWSNTGTFVVNGAQTNHGPLTVLGGGNVHTAGHVYVQSDTNSVIAAMAPVIATNVAADSAKLGSIAAANFATNSLNAWGFVDPGPTSAVQNVQWTPYFAATGTVRGIRSKTFSGTVVVDVIKQNWTNAISSYTTVYTGAVFNTSASNLPFNAAIAVGDMWGVISTNVTTATNWWYSMEWTP